MKIKTFSILAGSEACNARCPFCVSKMTPPNGVALKEPEVDWRNFEKACEMAKTVGATTAMFTSKGEPTLFPAQITKFLKTMEKYKFPLIEIQTNGIMIAQDPNRYLPFLQEWYSLGMTTFAVSIVHYNPEKNRENYLPHRQEYIDLPKLINFLHSLKFSVRLTCVAVNGMIDSSAALRNLIGFAKIHEAEQLTVTPVNKPKSSFSNQEVWDWTNRHHLTDEQVADIKGYLESEGTVIMRLEHGATVYDVQGQNVCLSQCLTLHPDNEELRNLIFYPNGHLYYNWEKKGAIIL